MTARSLKYIISEKGEKLVALSPRSQDSHKKDVNAMKNWLHGRNFAMASFALEYAAKFHIQKRKDLITPEFNHMIIIASYIRTMSDLMTFREEALAVAFLHDLCEDYNVTFEQIEKDFNEAWSMQSITYKREGLREFDVSRFIEALKLITKKYQGKKTPTEEYFSAMMNNPIASIVKGADRLHNLASCGCVFTDEKKREYVKETEQFILPMIKQAQRNFPHQNNIYENIKLVLKIEIDLIESTISKERK